MRTTVTLDQDVRSLLQRAVRERGISFKEALNAAVRAGLRAPAAAGATPYRLPAFRMGFRPEIPLDKALALAATLEDEETARKLALRK